MGGSAGTFASGRPEVNVTHISGQAYAATTLFTLASHDPGATIGTSTLTQTQVTGGAYALNNASFAFDAAFDFTTTQKAATLARVTLVDTTTTNTDMRGTDNAALAATALSTAVWTTGLATALGTIGTNGVGLSLVPWNSAWGGGSASDAVWNASTALFGTAGTYGALIETNIDGTISSRASQTSVDDLPTNAELATALGTADDAVLAQIALVKAKTDNLPSDPADESLIIAATDALATLIGDVPTNAELATALGTADDATLAAIAALSIPSATTIADAVLFRSVAAIEATMPEHCLGTIILLGLEATVSTTTLLIKGTDGTTTRFTKTVTLAAGADPIRGVS